MQEVLHSYPLSEEGLEQLSRPEVSFARLPNSPFPTSSAYKTCDLCHSFVFQEPIDLAVEVIHGQLLC